jgi:hypothetical protein
LPEEAEEVAVEEAILVGLAVEVFLVDLLVGLAVEVFLVDLLVDLAVEVFLVDPDDQV